MSDTYTLTQVADKLNAAKSIDELASAADLIGSVADEQQRKELRGLYEQREAALNTVEG